jgi:GAF domain-containing protein
MSRDHRVDRRYGDLPNVRALELESLPCVPLCWDGATRAVLYADHQQREGTFRRRDLRLLAAVADLLGAALEASGAREADEAVSAAR